MNAPLTLRRALLGLLRSVREPRLRRMPAPNTPMLRFATWPPVSHNTDAAALATRVQWFLPPVDTPATLNVPLSSDHLSLKALPSSTIVLLWNARSWRVLPLLASHKTSFFIVDPSLYASTEEAEWLHLYARHVTASYVTGLRDASNRNFMRLVIDVGLRPRVNVCGNGPNLDRIYDHDVRHDINIVCNAAVRSDRLLDHLRPTIIAFVNSPYFGPSDFARDHLARILRCAETYGSFLAIPEGYAHHLIRTHYPALASRIVALRLGGQMHVPTQGALDAQVSANVLTSLMLPLAAALNPSSIQVWGCDGQPSTRRGTWAYLPGLEPRIESVADAHPAFVEGLQADDEYLRRTYEAHGDHLERLLNHLEAHGLRVICATPSAIPALAHRSSPALQSPARSTHSAPAHRIR